MLLNHAGAAWINNGAASVVFLTFLGSFAPALFFTATGIGRGLHSTDRPVRLGRVVGRSTVLFLADAALWISPISWIGLDFLGFIALSTVIVALISQARHPGTVALALAGVCLVLRFGLAPKLALPSGSQGVLGVVHIVLGDAGVAEFSYPVAPWLTFPLVGFIIGRYAARCRPAIQGLRGFHIGVLTSYATGGLVVSAALYFWGFVFFRWGTVSIAYFALATAVVAVAIAAVMLLQLGVNPRLNGALSLPGSTSLIFVPVHYVLIICVGKFFQPLGAISFIIAASFAVVIAFGISRGLSVWFGRAKCVTGTTPLLLAAVAALLTLLASTPLGHLEWPTRTATQLVACLLFVLVSQDRAGGGTTWRAAHLWRSLRY